jgi:hypothetical protein
MRRFFLCVVLMCMASVAVAEQTDVVVVPAIDAEQFKFALTKARREVFDSGMALKGTQADAFWNTYGEFEKEKKPIDDKRTSLLQEYATKKEQLTDEQAVRLVNDFANVAQDDIKLRVKYTNLLAKKLPGVLAARFYQIDSYITTAMTLDLLDNMKLLGTD